MKEIFEEELKNLINFCKISDPNRDRVNTLSRFAGWGGEYKCKGMWRHGVCILSIRDLPFLTSRPHFFVNKFLLDYDPVSYQCMEEWLDEKNLAYKNNSHVNLFDICEFLADHSTLTKCDPKSRFNSWQIDNWSVFCQVLL